jgi:hypothetical protein
MEDAISPEAATTVTIPAGNKMTGNAAVDKVNGSGTAVSELGSYVPANTGWQTNGDYQMQFEWTPSQANGQISAICLTSKAWGFMGEGNSVSHSDLSDSYFDPYNGGTDNKAYIPEGNYYSKTLGSAQFVLCENEDNSVRCMNTHNLTWYSGNTNNAALSGKIVMNDFYFPLTEVDFYKYVSSHYSSTPIDSTVFDIPLNIRSDFMSGNTQRVCNPALTTFDAKNHMIHFVFGNGCSTEGSGSYANFYSVQTIVKPNKDVYCFHYDVVNKTLTADKITLPDAVIDGLYKTSTYTECGVSLYCNSTTLVVHRYRPDSSTAYPRNSSTNTTCPIYFINLSDSSYTESVMYHNQQDYAGYLYYEDNCWYIGGGSKITKVDNVSKTAYCLNITSSDNVQAMGNLSNMKYPLASLARNYTYGTASSSNLTVYGRYCRNKHYLATIYNLQTPVTKTANLSMQITYTLSFAEEE